MTIPSDGRLGRNGPKGTLQPREVMAQACTTLIRLRPRPQPIRKPEGNVWLSTNPNCQQLEKQEKDSFVKLMTLDKQHKEENTK